jgi:hypothetical protein
MITTWFGKSGQDEMSGEITRRPKEKYSYLDENRFTNLPSSES